MSVFIQFDGEITNMDALLAELKSKGIKVLSIKPSRWRDEENNDKGGRIDVEIADDAGDKNAYKQKISALETEMKKSKNWKKK